MIQGYSLLSQRLLSFKELPSIGQQGAVDARGLRGMITLEAITLLHGRPRLVARTISDLPAAENWRISKAFTRQAPYRGRQ
jgi:hypothetical protein